MGSSWEEPPAPMEMPQVAFPRMMKVTRRLLIANVALFLLSFTLYMVREETYFAITRPLELDQGQWIGKFPLVPAWQLLTYGFLHSVQDPWHILQNMLMLYFFGSMLEERLGGRRFFLTYMAAQVVGGLFFLAPCLFVPSGAHAIGASGAVFGVMIAAATIYPRRIVFLLFFPLQMRWLAVGIVGIELFSALPQLKGNTSDGVAHLVHLGGAAYGFLAVRFGLIDKDPIEILERKRAIHDVERAADDEARMDALLQKIHQNGMGSLTRSEREFLKRMSSRR